jgi:[ribosomal protein S18]-alanine N-acetyltransferase
VRGARAFCPTEFPDGVRLGCEGGVDYSFPPLAFKDLRRRKFFREEIAMTTSHEAPIALAGRQGHLPVHIRWMIRRDMPEVLAIEQQCFEFPWYEDDFIRCLRQRNCIGMVAEASERVVGFMIYELHKNRLHILNFAVHETHRRRGVGSQMSRKLIGKLSQDRRSRILLEIRETNLAAQLFFRQLGFRAVSVLRDFYEDTTEDAYLMQYRHTAASAALAEQERPRRMAG